MRNISLFLAAGSALCLAACGHQPSASQETAQAVQVAQPQAGAAPAVQLAVADTRPYAPDEVGGDSASSGPNIAALEAAQDAAGEEYIADEPENAVLQPRPLPPGYVYASDLRDPWAYDGERCQHVRDYFGDMPRAEAERRLDPMVRNQALACL